MRASTIPNPRRTHEADGEEMSITGIRAALPPLQCRAAHSCVCSGNMPDSCSMFFWGNLDKARLATVVG